MRVRANPLLAFLALPLAASWAPLSASWAPFALRPRASAPRIGCDAVVCAMPAEEYSAVEAAADALLAADDKVVITASPVFMARPWLERYLGVPAANVYGAELEQKNGRFTGKVLGEIPISEAKVDLLKSSVAAADGVQSVGYGDHPTDVPFLLACDKGVLVHEPAQPIDPNFGDKLVYTPAAPFPPAKLDALIDWDVD